MAKRKSKVPDWLQEQIDEARAAAHWLESRRGATDSYWHRELERRQAAAAEYAAADDGDRDEGRENDDEEKGQRKSEVKDNG